MGWVTGTKPLQVQKDSPRYISWAVLGKPHRWPFTAVND